MQFIQSVLLLLLTGNLCAQIEPDYSLTVISGDRKPYQMAADRIAKELGQTGSKSRVVTLQELKKQDDWSAKSKTKIIYAVGSPAAAWLAKHRPKGAILLYCMVTDPERYGLLGNPYIHGVSALPSVATQFSHIRQALPNGRLLGFCTTHRPSMVGWH